MRLRKFPKIILQNMVKNQWEDGYKFIDRIMTHGTHQMWYYFFVFEFEDKKYGFYYQKNFAGMWVNEIPLQYHSDEVDCGEVRAYEKKTMDWEWI